MISAAKSAGLITKSNLILGLGETREEIASAMGDLIRAGCQLLTVTQYLRPSLRHHPVDRWVRPEEFIELKEEAEALGFAGVMSGPLVRSSYRAGRLYRQAMDGQCLVDDRYVRAKSALQPPSTVTGGIARGCLTPPSRCAQSARSCGSSPREWSHCAASAPQPGRHGVFGVEGIRQEYS